jgi:hypothetical protein
MANTAIDYTSRDFQSLKADIIKVVQDRLSNSVDKKVWDATDPADFAVALVEAFAYVGDVANYYIDRAANEAYLPTAVQRSSVLKLARAINYNPSGFTQSVVDVTVSNNTETAALIPFGTQLTVTVPTANKSTTRLIFTVSETVEVPAKTGGTEGTATATLYYGEDISLRPENLAQSSTEIDGEYLTTSSTGYAYQSYTLKETNPVDSSVRLYVEENGEYVLWTRVEHLYDYGPSANVYSLVTNADNSVTVSFGDGTSGAVPSTGAEIRVQYAVLPQGGPIGNIPAGLKDWKVTAVPSNLDITAASLAHLKFNNADVGSGGSDPESTASIRLNAPKALSAMTRAVALLDFATLSAGVPGVGANKSASYAESPKSVLVYVGPEKDNAEQSWYPGFNDTNSEIKDSLLELTDTVHDYLVERSQIGTSVTVLPPEYVDVNIVILYERPAELTDVIVQDSIKNALFNNYGYEGVKFDTPIWVESLESDLKSKSVANRVKVLYLYKDSEEARLAPTRSTLIPGQGELLIFSDKLREGTTDLEAFQMFPIAALNNLTYSSGKVNRTFNSSVYKYSLKIANGISSVTLTPTKVISDDVVTYKINGKPHSGGTFTSIPVNKKQIIEVIVTSEDTANVTTYTVTVLRAKA